MVSEQVLNQAKNRLKIEFGRFWNSFVGKVGSAENTHPEELFEFVTDVDRGSVDFCTIDGKAIRFQQVPARSDQSSNRVDVCIQFKHSAVPKTEEEPFPLELRASKVSVTYLDTTQGRRGDAVDIKRGLRFEFDENPQQNHPVFHAHFDRRCIDSQVLTSEYQIDPDADEVSNPNYPRIPSAPMDLMSVIQLVLHEHLPDELVENGWPSGTHSNLQNHPTFPSHTFNVEPQDEIPMISDWWYLHQARDEDGNVTREVPSWRLPS